MSPSSLDAAVPDLRPADAGPSVSAAPGHLSHLRRLEAEAVFIFREVVAQFSRPVMLYSVGKDSSVLLHLAVKAFWPAPPPFPLLHIDTGWKFAEMIAFRDRAAAGAGMALVAHTNRAGAEAGVTPFTHAPSVYTDVMKTQGLRQALDAGGFDAAFGGARRDEEASRAKERVFSFRSRGHGWDPKTQRPELWSLYNGRIERGQSIRAFPLSNWTELDVWHYIRAEAIPIVPLYFAAPRPVVRRGDQWIMRDDERLALEPGEAPQMRRVRFRTLGCYPLTAAMESEADTLDAVIAETAGLGTSERAGRLIDHDASGAMERKKREGYF